MQDFFKYVIYVAQLANKAELFPDRRGVALGLATAGMSLGTAFITPLAEWLTRVMPVMTGIALQGVVYGLLVIIAGFLIVEAPSGYKPANWIEPEMGALGGEGGSAAVESAVAKEVDLNWKRLIITPSFWLLFMFGIFGGILAVALSSNISLIAQQVLGVNTAQAT